MRAIPGRLLLMYLFESKIPYESLSMLVSNYLTANKNLNSTNPIQTKAESKMKFSSRKKPITAHLNHNAESR